jgi:hypothetical protein
MVFALIASIATMVIGFIKQDVTLQFIGFVGFGIGLEHLIMFLYEDDILTIAKKILKEEKETRK